MTPSDSEPPTDLREQQLQHEAAMRQAALGRRVRLIEDGKMGPVLRRWINADVVPIADMLRTVAKLYIKGDMEGVALALGTPTTALSQRERPLRPLMEWALRGRSPGRGELKDTTNAEDMALAFMGSIIPRLAKDGATLSASLSIAAEALRDTVQGQFISGIQGAEAMQRIRERHPEKWQQKRSLQRIAMQLRSQVKPQFLAEERGETEIPLRGSRKVIHVTDYRGDLRRLEFLRTPDEVDWEVMSLCWQDAKDGGDHPYRNIWLALASMLLSISQQTGGWFEVVDRFKQAGRRKHKTKILQLSSKAFEAISRDVERWIGSGFVAEPMVVPPEDGDYLSVKHRKVTGQRPPKGMITRPEGSFAWASACEVAKSPWEVNPYSPAFSLPNLEDDPFLTMKLAAHRRIAGGPFYLPVNMDFRGRLYYRTPWVTPQSNDLGKSLLKFPPNPYRDMLPEEHDALTKHLTGLTGNDKVALAVRRVEYAALTRSDVISWDGANSPLTLQAHLRLLGRKEWDSIPVQLDGSCNGLQHLSALTRDEVGAAEVNLTEGGSKPKDIYGKVAFKTAEALYPLRREDWVGRFTKAGINIDRSLCKQPVMVLPYGGTLEAIRLAIKANILDQLGMEPSACPVSPWHDVLDEGYAAFRTRNLEDHPLFNEDVRLLAKLVWENIKPVIPKAMATMDTLQEIGKWVGDRALAWQTGPAGEPPMWVVQAKSKAARKQVTLRGYHLPDVIRRLTLVSQTNEIDPRAHRTGIVANFTHSLDAAHLARAIRKFKDRGGTCVGTIHDCVMVRPSEARLMGECLREAFKEMYEEDPLSRPVKLIPLDGGDEIVYGSWYELAASAGVSFPEPGAWQPSEVLSAEWFFS